MMSANQNQPLLDVDSLCVDLSSARIYRRVVDQLSFQVNKGEVLAIVGESGSGKSITTKTLMGLLPNGAKVTGSARFSGLEILNHGSNNSSSKVTKLRGTSIGMIFQEPMSALNPVLTIGTQLTEAILFHGLAEAKLAKNMAIEMLERVGITHAVDRLSQYPHEFSGGMRQRVLIAMTMLLRPQLIIADEPTTALDVTIQSQILDLLKELVQEQNIGLILITHDMGVVAEIADEVLVMKAGKAREIAPVKQIFRAPEDDYTKALLKAVPRLETEQENLSEALKTQTPVLKIRNISKYYSSKRLFWQKGVDTPALNNLSLDVFAGETLAIVGESGSGKSTLGRAIIRLIPIDKGSIKLRELDLNSLKGGELRKARSRVQMIFQDPYSSLDPRVKIGKTIEEPMIIHASLAQNSMSDKDQIRDKDARQLHVKGLLERVGLSPDMADRYPHEFSGGQRQRIAIARALSCQPDIIIADEPTSALDVSVQAQVLELLKQLKDDFGLTLIFISHDLAVVSKTADRVAVMRKGEILELGPTISVLNDPQHKYTKALLAAAPVPDPERARKKYVALPDVKTKQKLQEIKPDHWVAS